MRLLFAMDTKDYKANGTVFVRNSARSIIIKNGLVAMVHSLKYDYYKFPGGGIEQCESAENAVIRETLEETGLVVIPESVKEYGYVHRIQKDDVGIADIFEQDNFYFFCEVEESIHPQNLDSYEAEEKFTLEYVQPDKAILANRKNKQSSPDKIMNERDAKVLELLIKEGYFNKKEGLQ